MQEKQQLNAKDIKEKIKNFLSMVGPSLPVNIARHIGINTLFTSAFLSEMASESTIKISNMKVGGSPLYYSPEKESMLENFHNFLGGKEKEAFSLLKERKFLLDSEQHPAIRVALRALKDFAIPFKKEDKIYWRYFNAKQEEFEQKEIKEPEKEQSKDQEQRERVEEKPIEKIRKFEEKLERIELDKLKKELEEKNKELDDLKKELVKIPDQQEARSEEKPKEKEKKKKPIKKPIKKKAPDETFLNEIKEFLSKKNIELIKTEYFDKKQVYAIIKINDKDTLLASYNKKKIDDKDIITAYKKAQALGMQYALFSKGDISKKTKEAVEAYKSLINFDKLE